MPGKVKYHNLSEEEKKKCLGEFYTMVSMLEGREEVKNFFKDLLTLSEMVMITRRIQIAKMLLEGYSIEEIINKLRVGSATVIQVSRWLNNGFGGYKSIIKKYKKHEGKFKTKKDVSAAAPLTFEWIRKKYPAHFALVNLLINQKNKSKNKNKNLSVY